MSGRALRALKSVMVLPDPGGPHSTRGLCSASQVYSRLSWRTVSMVGMTRSAAATLCVSTSTLGTLACHDAHSPAGVTWNGHNYSNGAVLGMLPATETKGSKMPFSLKLTVSHVLWVVLDRDKARERSWMSWTERPICLSHCWELSTCITMWLRGSDTHLSARVLHNDSPSFKLTEAYLI